MSEKHENLLSTEQCAELLGISVEWLEAARLRGDGPVFVKIGKNVRYAPKKVHDFIRENEFKSTSEYTQHQLNKKNKQLRKDQPSSE